MKVIQSYQADELHGCEYEYEYDAPKFPMMLMTPKMSPFFERMVMYEPCAFPGTGAAADAAVSRSCIFPVLPILSLVAYTVNTNT